MFAIYGFQALNLVKIAKASRDFVPGPYQGGLQRPLDPQLNLEKLNPSAKRW